MLSENVEKNIRLINDFPEEGVLFRDITTILQDGKLFDEVITEMVRILKPLNIDKVLGLESRGFFFAGTVANRLGAGFIPVRKPGKLPYLTYEQEYDLEYGKNIICIHQDALDKNSRVAIIDDVLATGGTMEACIKLVEKFNIEPVMAIAFMELNEFNGRSKITCPFEALLKY